MRGMTFEQLREGFKKQVEKASQDYRDLHDAEERALARATAVERRAIVAIVNTAWEDRAAFMKMVKSNPLYGLLPHDISSELLNVAFVSGRFESMKNTCDTISRVLSCTSVGTTEQRVKLICEALSEYCDNIESELKAAEALAATGK